MHYWKYYIFILHIWLFSVDSFCTRKSHFHSKLGKVTILKETKEKEKCLFKNIYNKRIKKKKYIYNSVCKSSFIYTTIYKIDM